jgi:N-acetylglucosaminylphosphatidylinositol deacetylase
MQLGLRSEADVAVLDDPEFPDSMTKEWSATAIASLLNTHFLRTASKGSSRRKDVTAAVTEVSRPTTIDVLITFDRTGVSSHPNHRSLYHGAVAWVQELARGRSGWESPVALYTLTSVNVVRKYVGLLDAPGTLVISVLRSIGSRRREFPDRPVFLSDVGAYLAARRAMTQAHRSQMLWFRWGWITMGRYMYVNDLQRCNIR